MEQNGIQAKTKWRFKATTKSPHELLVAENLLGRGLRERLLIRFGSRTSPLIWRREGWMYLAAILGAYNRQIVGWSMGDTLNHRIPAQALEKGILYRLELKF